MPHLPVTISTNADAEAALRAGRVPTDPRRPVLFSADEQTGGVGRRGSGWASPPGGVWASLACCLPEPPGPVMTGLGFRLGVAVIRTLHDAGVDTARLKWPNDALVARRKIAGCMARTVVHAGRTWAVLGVGINADNPARALTGLRIPATSLTEELGRPVDPAAVRELLFSHLPLAARTPGVPPDDLEFARAHLDGVGRPHRYRLADGSLLEGRLDSLTPDGSPLLRGPAGEPIAVPPTAEPEHTAA